MSESNGYDWFTKRRYGDNVTVIDMGVPWADCCICGEPSLQMGIPVFEDLVLPNDYEGEWGGRPACPECFAAQSKLVEPMEFHKFRRLVREAKG